jgi:O-antigen ligase
LDRAIFPKVHKLIEGLSYYKLSPLRGFWNEYFLPILYLFNALFLLCFIGYALLSPEIGGQRWDPSLLPFTGGLSIRICTYIELAIGIFVIVSYAKTRAVRRVGSLLIIFTALIIIRNAYADHMDSVVLNIAFCLAFFVANYWASTKNLLYRKAYPYLLLVIFTSYGILAMMYIMANPFSLYRLQIIFKQANHLGNVLAFALIYFFSIAVSVKTARLRFVLWLTITMLTIALVHTISRGAWLGFIIGLIICAFYLNQYISRKVIARSIALLMVIGLGAIIIWSPARILRRFARNSSDVQLSAGERLKLWRNTVVIIRDHWLVGIGVGAFSESPLQNHRNDSRFESAMNNYLTLASETGLPCLMLYFACLYYSCNIASMICCYKHQDGLRLGINIGLLCGVYSMIIFALSTYTLECVYANTLMWGSLGYLISLEESKFDVKRCRVHTVATRCLLAPKL